MGVWQIAGVALLSCMVLLLLKEWRPAMTVPLRLSVTVLVTGAALLLYVPVLSQIGEMFTLSGGAEYATPLLRAAAIALVCELSATLCRDMGEGTLASGVQWFGRIEILLLCLPLVDGLLAVAKELLS